MSKNKAEEIMKKRLAKRKEEAEQSVEKEIKESLTQEAYVVCKKPDTKTNNFLLVKIKYDIITMKAIVEDYVDLEEKVIGMRFPIEQGNLKYYFDKLKKHKRSE